MSDVLAFWLVATLIALLAFPIASALLRRLPDAGAGMSFAAGLVLVGYGYFVLRTVSVLPAGRGGYLLALGLLGLAGAATAGRDRRFLSTVRRTWPGMVVAAGVFSLAFFAYVAFRSYNPDIGGTEQPMDLMYLNATLVSPDYPPQDPWLSGERASYYYFGYLQSGVLTAASGVPASTGYNLSLAYTFAAAAAGVASLAFGLARWILGSRAQQWALAAGGIAVAMLLFVGSLSAIFEWSAAHGQYNATLYSDLGLDWLLPCAPAQTDNCYAHEENPRTTAWYPTRYWFWWDHTRLIPGTIVEAPFFSFLLGDLHPHVMSIPLVVLALGLSAATFRGRRPLSWANHRRQPWAGVAFAVIVGALAFENAWDLPTFGGLFGLAVLARNLRARPPTEALLASVGYLGPIYLGAVVAYIPWYRDFSSQAQGLRAYVGAGTRPVHALQLFAPLGLAALCAVGWAGVKTSWSALGNALLSTAWLPLLPFIGWLLLASGYGELDAGIRARTDSGWATLIIYALCVWALSAAALVLFLRRHPAAIVAAFGALGALLLLGVELYLVKDVFFGSAFVRQNTVFKLAYQAWIVLSVGGAVSVAWGLRAVAAKRDWRGALALPAAVLVVGGLAYPLTAAPNRTEGFGNSTSIDGFAAIARNDPAEYALTRWIGDNTAGDDVIFEASGRKWRPDDQGNALLFDSNVDYSEAGRIASRTGRPTPIGWFFHEIQWRGDTPANKARFRARQDVVDSAYTSRDRGTVLAAMRQMNARYLVVGRVELADYAPDLMADFASFMDVAFESGAVRVYRMPQYHVLETS
jgi:YYY domain-containing protein